MYKRYRVFIQGNKDYFKYAIYDDVGEYPVINCIRTEIEAIWLCDLLNEKEDKLNEQDREINLLFEMIDERNEFIENNLPKDFIWSDIELSNILREVEAEVSVLNDKVEKLSEKIVEQEKTIKELESENRFLKYRKGVQEEYWKRYGSNCDYNTINDEDIRFLGD